MKIDVPGHFRERTALQNLAPQGVSSAVAAKAADLNGDGFADLVLGLGGDRSGFFLVLGDGNGNWSAVAPAPSSIEARHLAVADVDYDQRPEVLVAGTGARKGLELWTYLTEQQGWQLHSVPTDVGTYTAVALVDVNEDGLVDIVAARGAEEAQGGIDVWLNDGMGGWIGGFGPQGKGRYTDVAVADIDGDGHLDLIAARRGGMGALSPSRRRWLSTGGINIWYGDGDTHWQPQPLIGEGDVEALTVHDINGDGRLDVIAGTYRLGIQLWLNQGDGRWRYRREVDEGSWGDVAVADLDADGQPELIAASRDGRGLRVWSWFRSGFHPRQGLLPDADIYLGVEAARIKPGATPAVIAVTDHGRVEVWADRAAIPSRMPPVPRTIASLAVAFPPNASSLDAIMVQAMQKWWEQHQATDKPWQFRIRASKSLDASLRHARMQALTRWLLDRGVRPRQIVRQIDAQGRLNADTLELTIVALPAARLPTGKKVEVKRQDLFHVKANKVFKTINGIPEYIVGAGDELAIVFWHGSEAKEYKVTVQVDGTVSLPYHPNFQVKGLTTSEIDDKLTQFLRTFERHPRVDVRLLKAQSKTVSIFGEVQSLQRQPTGPGTYYLKGRESLIDFIARAGGPTKDADLTRVQITRGSKTFILNLDRAIAQGDFAQNAVLDDGDTIFIPSIKESKHLIYVLGDGIKPGIVEFKGESIHLLDVVLKSGGFKPEAYLPDIRVVRADQGRPLIFAAAFDRFVEKGDLTQNLLLKDKDIVIVPAEPIANWNRMINKIMPTINSILTTGTSIEEVLRVRDILRGVSVTGGGFVLGVGG